MSQKLLATLSRSWISSVNIVCHSWTSEELRSRISRLFRTPLQLKRSTIDCRSLIANVLVRPSFEIGDTTAPAISKMESSAAKLKTRQMRTRYFILDIGIWGVWNADLGLVFLINKCWSKWCLLWKIGLSVAGPCDNLYSIQRQKPNKDLNISSLVIEMLSVCNWIRWLWYHSTRHSLVMSGKHNKNSKFWLVLNEFVFLMPKKSSSLLGNVERIRNGENKHVIKPNLVFNKADHSLDMCTFV